VRDLEIPLTNDPNQEFSVSIPFDDRNVALKLRFNWNIIAELWEISIIDGVTDEDILLRHPLTFGGGAVGAILDITEAFAYKNIGKINLVRATDSAPDDPQVDSWGVDYFLFVSDN